MVGFGSVLTVNMYLTSIQFITCIVKKRKVTVLCIECQVQRILECLDLSEENTSFRETIVGCLRNSTLNGNLFESCPVKISFLVYLESSLYT